MPKTETTKAKKKTASKTTTDAVDTLAVESQDDWFVSLSDVEDHVNLVYYGKEGSAKTTNAAFMANLTTEGKVLIINSEGGLKKRTLQKRGIDTNNIVIWPNPKKHERVTHKSLNEIYRRVKIDLENDPESWAGVIFDSITEIHTAILDSVQAKRIQLIRNRGQEPDEDFVDISDYGTMSKLVRDTLRSFRDLPCHFAVTALERRDVDKDTGRPQYGPAVTPGLQADLLGYVDLVIMCKAEDEDGPFRGLTRANSRYRAKDRFDVVPRVMVEPNFERVAAYAYGQMDMDDPSSDPVQERMPARALKAQDKSQSSNETDDDEADDVDDDD